MREGNKIGQKEINSLLPQGFFNLKRGLASHAHNYLSRKVLGKNEEQELDEHHQKSAIL